MNRLSIPKKLYSAIVLMLVSISLMVMTTAAWFTLSTAPAVENIKVAVGGDNTIKIAPNIEEVIDGVKVSYPGAFKKVSTLDVDKDALLTPVSTSDGVNWFVLKDDVKSSQDPHMSLDDFELDKEYKYANTPDGGYMYVDFWIASSIDNCIIRLTSGDSLSEETGSYVIQLPQSVKDFKNESGYHLDDSYQSLSSSIRVGFLIDDDEIEDNGVMTSYMNSSHYDKLYKQLRGNYRNNSDYSFLIYEPNGLAHSNEGQSAILTSNGVKYINCKDGEYHVTQPIGLNVNNEADFMNIANSLVVQTRNKWKKTNNSLIIDDLYQAYLMSSSSDKSLKTFYNDYLQSTYLPYVDSGKIFENTWDLYFAGDDHLLKKSEDISNLDFYSNVNDSLQIVRLKKNVPQKVRMFVWIEGQDIDCNSFAANQAIALRLELAGSSGS